LKKKIIKQEGDFPGFIIGISSQQFDFQIAWIINNILQISLNKTKSVSIRFKTKEIVQMCSFSSFSHTDLDGNYFYLLSNKEEGVILYPKFKNIDFFFIVKSEDNQLEDILKRISVDNFIIGCFIIPVNNVLQKIIERVFDS